MNQVGESQLPKALGLAPADTAGTEMTPPSSTRNAKHQDGRMALNPNTGKRAMEETADGGDEHGAPPLDSGQKRQRAVGGDSPDLDHVARARQPSLKRPRDEGDGDGRRGAAGGHDDDAERASGGASTEDRDVIIPCLWGVTTSPLRSDMGVDDCAENDNGPDDDVGMNVEEARGGDDMEMQEVDIDAAGGDGSGRGRKKKKQKQKKKPKRKERPNRQGHYKRNAAKKREKKGATGGGQS